MKKIIGSLLMLLVFFISNLYAQDITTVEAKKADISDNLDLEAIASIFGESENLEDFENRLNDPELQICNLDLNEDGFVDYLRVVENSKDQTILITIQAVLGEDLYQDVATIDVEKDNNGKTYVQVVGDVYMYGPDYIIEPVYVHPPVVVVYFWSPYYSPWHSPYYYGYYPPHYHSWHPHPPHVYRRNVHVHVSAHHRYYHKTVRRSSTAVHIQNTSRRNDYGRTHPNKSFSLRNTGVKNTQELNRQRGTTQKATSTGSSGIRTSNTRSTTATKSTGRPVQNDWNSSSNRYKGNIQAKNNKSSGSAGRSNTKSVQNKSGKSNSSNSKSTRQSSNHSSNNKSTRQSGNQISNNKSTRPSGNQRSNTRSTGKSGNTKSNSKGTGKSQGRSKRR